MMVYKQLRSHRLRCFQRKQPKNKPIATIARLNSQFHFAYILTYWFPASLCTYLQIQTCQTHAHPHARHNFSVQISVYLTSFECVTSNKHKRLEEHRRSWRCITTCSQKVCITPRWSKGFYNRARLGLARAYAYINGFKYTNKTHIPDISRNCRYRLFSLCLCLRFL